MSHNPHKSHYQPSLLYVHNKQLMQKFSLPTSFAAVSNKIDHEQYNYISKLIIVN